MSTRPAAQFFLSGCHSWPLGWIFCWNGMAPGFLERKVDVDPSSLALLMLVKGKG
jgi:hypothetical protein